MLLIEKEIIQLIVIVASTLFVAAYFIIGYVVYFSKRQARTKQERIDLEARFQSILLQSKLEIQEQTLKAVSQEIHDNVGQILSLAKINLNRISLDVHPEIASKFADTKSLISKALADLRAVSRLLNTDNVATIGLLKALDAEAALLRTAGYDVSYEHSGEIPAVLCDKELILFRMGQETISNIIKHSNATAIDISVHCVELFRMKISDNGVGLDVMGDSPGIGLKNLRDRAAVIKATVNIESAHQKGTDVTITMDLN